MSEPRIEFEITRIEVIMKILLSTLMVLVSFISYTSAQAIRSSDIPKPKSTGKVSAKYDKGKNITTVRLKQMTISKLKNEKDVANNLPLHQMDLEMWFSYSGRSSENSVVNDVVFEFHAVGSNYIFLRGQQIIVALDRDLKGQDRAFSLGMTDYKSSAPKFNSVFEEFMSITAPSQAIEKIAKATSAEIYVGPIGYKLSNEQQKAIAELAAFLPKPTLKTAPVKTVADFVKSSNL